MQNGYRDGYAVAILHFALKKKPPSNFWREAIPKTDFKVCT